MLPRRANPFFVGYHTRTSKEGTVVEQDGFVSCLLVMITLLSLGVSMSMAHWSTLTTQRVYVDKMLVETVLIIYMLLATAVMIVLRCSTRPGVLNLYQNADSRASGTLSLFQESYRDSDQLIESGLHKKIRQSLPLIGITIFYIFGSFQDLMRILAHVWCYSVFSSCKLLLKYLVSTAFHGIRLFFMGTEMVFCIYFQDKVFRKCCATRYSLTIILVATATVLFDAILYDSKEIFHTTDTVRNTCNGTVPSNCTESVKSCVEEETDLYRASETWSPYIYPLNIEFLLLVSEVLVHLFCSLEVMKGESNGSRSLQKVTNDEEAENIADANQSSSLTHRGECSSHESNSIEYLDGEQETINSDQFEDDSTYKGVSFKSKELGQPVQNRGNISIAGSSGNFRNSRSNGSTGRSSRIPRESSHSSPSLRSRRESDLEFLTTLEQIQRQIEIKLHALSRVIQGQNSPDSVGSRRETRTLVRHLRQDLTRLERELLLAKTSVYERDSLAAPGHIRGLRSVRLRVTPSSSRQDEERQQILGRNAPRGSNYGSVRDSRRMSSQNAEDTMILPHGGATDTDAARNPGGGFTYSVYLCVLCNLVFLVLGIMTYVEESELTKVIYTCFKIIYWVLLLSVCCTGYCFSRSLRSRFHDFHGLEVAVVLTVFTTSLYYFFYLTAVVPCLLGSQLVTETGSHLLPLFGYFSSVMPWIGLFDKLLNLVEIFLQTCFMFHAARLSGRCAAAGDLARFRLAVLFLAISNLTLWVTDSAVEMKNVSLEPVQGYYYHPKNWDLIIHTTMPLTLFYRFNSFIIFMEIFLDH